MRASFRSTSTTLTASSASVWLSSTKESCSCCRRVI